MKLLIVEDDPEDLEFLLEALNGCEALGEIDFEHVKDGPSAISALVRGGFGVVLIDMVLPGRTGADVAKVASSLGVPFGILTGSAGLAKSLLGPGQVVFEKGKWEKVLEWLGRCKCASSEDCQCEP